MNQQQAREFARKRLKDAHPEEYLAYYREALGREPHPCRICGSAVWKEKSLQCGDPFCYEAWNALRYVVDLEQRERAVIATARGVLKQRTAKPSQLRHAQRIVDGNVPINRRRWLVEGSRTFALAVACIERRLPIAAEFPRQIANQLSAVTATA